MHVKDEDGKEIYVVIDKSKIILLNTKNLPEEESSEEPRIVY